MHGGLECSAAKFSHLKKIMAYPLGTFKKAFTITLESLMPLILNFNLK